MRFGIDGARIERLCRIAAGVAAGRITMIRPARRPRIVRQTRTLRADDPGVRRSLPGAPVYPGVLLVEMAGQHALVMAALAAGAGADAASTAGIGSRRWARRCAAVDAYPPTATFLGAGAPGRDPHGAGRAGGG
ncbi:MAG: hypothetical protein U5L05_18200 [Rubrivivax sp.]|nr:hypothetical protein [Rubrivivax sp.]